MKFVYDANSGRYIMIVPTRRSGREREKQEPEPRPVPTAKEWERALNSRVVAGANAAEVSTQSKELLSQVGGINPGAIISVQNSKLPSGVGVVRCNLANLEALLGLIALVGANTFSAQVTIQEGTDGDNIVTSTYVVPLGGLVVPVKGNFVTATLEQFFSPARTIFMMAEIVPGDPREFYATIDATTVNTLTVPRWATHVGFAVVGGVVAGDTIEIYNPNLSSNFSFVAREGGIYPIGQQGARVDYTTIGVKNIRWQFYGWR